MSKVRYSEVFGNGYIVITTQPTRRECICARLSSRSNFHTSSSRCLLLNVPSDLDFLLIPNAILNETQRWTNFGAQAIGRPRETKIQSRCAAINSSSDIAARLLWIAMGNFTYRAALPCTAACDAAICEVGNGSRRKCTLDRIRCGSGRAAPSESNRRRIRGANFDRSRTAVVRVGDIEPRVNTCRAT